jgi:sarcosine oxidase, subunit beta
MRDRAQVVIVGGGIMGLAIAYHLAHDHGVSDVTVVEQGYLCSGASGRNGGGVRAQFSSETNVRLMQESIRLCKNFAKQMKINVWFRQGGYLFLARSATNLALLETNVSTQNQAGLPTRMLTPQEASKVVPQLDMNSVVGASYNPDDGVVFPWPFLWGYAECARKLGVDIATHTEVTGIRIRNKTIEAVTTSRGEIKTNTVINAAGAWSPQIAKMVGVELPNKPHRHEICSTEPLKPWLAPLVADLESGLYFSQSTRGEIVGGISNHDVPEGINMDSSHDFLRLYARELVKTCPVLGRVKVLRQWAGCYDLTPDANPIVGEVDEIDRFFQISGFMGHGFMMAPVMGKLMAQHVVQGNSLPLFDRWSLRRFKEGRLLSEGMILG